jgi:hypothetical protein
MLRGAGCVGPLPTVFVEGDHGRGIRGTIAEGAGDEQVVVAVVIVHVVEHGGDDIGGEDWHEIYGSGSSLPAIMIAMPITPDTKDWTWVLERPCPECHFDASTFGAAEVPGMILANARAWPGFLEREDAAVRPDESTWSTLEYGAHVRDVYRLFHARLRLMLDELDPQFDNWDQDATALAERYDQQYPATVASETVAAGEALAEEYAALTPEQWARTGRRSDGAVFTVETFSKYLLHDVEHHVWDVKKPAG